MKWIDGIIEDINERKLSRIALQKAYDELERRVHERTKDLRSANENLKREITDRKRAEEINKKLDVKLRHAQKLRAIGTLAGGIAHDFNNLLAPIIGYTQLAMSELEPANQAGVNLHQVLEASLRAKDLVNQILTFSNKAEGNLNPIKLNTIADDALKLLRSTLPSTITIHKQIDDNLRTVNADQTQIHQVLMNLCVNAGQSMPEGGDLAITISNVDIDQEAINEDEEVKYLPYVRITVSDTGVGMSKETLSHIFDPYFTTKEIGHGTGLGLSVVHSIVEKHEGHITVYSEPDLGTSIHVYIPATERPTESENVEQKKSEQADRGDEKILIVDDEPMVAELIFKTLQRKGYCVKMCTASQEAFEIFRTDPGSYDLVITDQTMPKMTGGKLAQALLGIRPDLPIILCTGFSETISKERSKEIGIKKFLTKPFAGTELTSTVRQVLDESRPSAGS